MINLTGKKFGRLMVIKRVKNDNNNRPQWICRCDCGKIVLVEGRHLRQKQTKSCGCYRSENSKKMHTSHGLHGTRFYRIWRGMFDRCKDKDKNYLSNNITVCNRWKKFENFRDDMYESYLKHIEMFGEKETTIDRIKNKNNYIPSNVKWSTAKEQARNRGSNYLITYNGKTKLLIEWAEEFGLNYKTLLNRVFTLKWDPIKSIITPKI